MDLTSDVLRQLPKALRIEIEENALRKDLTQTELAALQEEILATIRERRKPGRRTDLKPTSGKTLPEVHATAVVGKLFGESRTQVEKRIAIVRAAAADPERFGKLRDDLNRTGRVNAPFKRLKVIRQAAAIRAEPPPFPSNGPYRVIVADPPWPYEIRNEDPSHRGTHPYTTMSIAQICEMPVGRLAHKDCILWLWTTNHHMRQAFEVLDAWEFEQKTILSWIKDKVGLGDWLRGQSEHCLMAVRGKPTVQMVNQSTVLHAPRGEHSAKPREFYDLVESLCPAPRYAELFSRHSRPNWDGHGDEHPEAAE